MLRRAAVLLLVALVRGVGADSCPNACSGNGRCTIPGRICQCFDGYTGPDCSLLVCPFHAAWADQAIAVDVAHQPAECSNMGICDRITGTCTCRLGYEGKACERRSCPMNCNGLGNCVSMNYYAQTQDPGSLTPFTGSPYTYNTNWDANMIYGCDCDDNQYGISCSKRQCPLGDDPMTGYGASTASNPNQVNEIQRGQCKAGQGFLTLTFKGLTTAPIPYNVKAPALQAAVEALPNVGTGGTRVIMSSAQACTDTGGSWTIEFLYLYGYQPLFIADSSLLSFSSAVQTVSLSVSIVQIGTKENIECSGRGLCDASTGFCTCSTNYDTSNGYAASGIRGDCGYATQAIQQCPGTVSCSGHGQCAGSPTYRCNCDTGWTGSDCSNRLCPTDVAWFTYPSANNLAHVSEQVECGNAGDCDRATGTCVCDAGYTGAACNRLTCAGTTGACNLHGQCLDMYTLAKLSTINGVIPTGTSAISYGTVPNNPLTWDALKIFGCLCDTGYTGYDCSLLMCPYGDDPDTQEQVDEKQIISCQVPTSTYSGAQISFVYKQQQGPVISLVVGGSSPTSADDLVNNLQSIPGIRKVSITAVNPATDTLTSMCTTAGNNLLVTFLTEHGNLPLLQPIYLPLGVTGMSVTVKADKDGNKEMIECSGRGICNRANGKCTCFNGYGSSDGTGKAGLYGDCGYIQPIST